MQNAGKPLAKDPAQYEKAADKLRGEFGDTHSFHVVYVSGIHSADAESAHRVARRVKGCPVAPAVQAEAPVAIDRPALIGTKLDRKLTAAAKPK